MQDHTPVTTALHDSGLTRLQLRAAAAQHLKERRVWDAICKPIADWDAGPLLWLTKHTFSEDTHSLEKGTNFKAHFPGRDVRPDFETIIEYLLSKPSVLIQKSREQMATWLVTGFITWHCLTQNTFWICQSAKESKSEEIVEYARILCRNGDKFLQQRNPVIVDNSLELRFQGGGRLLGVAGGVDQVRGFHAHGFFQDEAAFIPEAQASHDVARPVVKVYVGVSTDEMGWFHQACKLEDAGEQLTGGSSVGDSTRTIESAPLVGEVETVSIQVPREGSKQAVQQSVSDDSAPRYSRLLGIVDGRLR